MSYATSTYDSSGHVMSYATSTLIVFWLLEWIMSQVVVVVMINTVISNNDVSFVINLK
jgi:hypothetical protein